MADPLSSLRDRLLAAPQPVTLSAAFIASAGATPPPGFDDELRAAFRLGAALGLEVSFQAANVGPIVGQEFTITKARLSFLGYDSAKSDVKIRFRQGPSAVEVVIETVLSDWSFTVTFPTMTGWPFDRLSYAKPTFVFATEKTAWAWSGGATVEVGRGQNFVATLTVPAAFQPTFELVKGLGVVPPSLTIEGPIEVDKVTFVSPPKPMPLGKPVVLYPDLDLRAQITTAPVEVFFLTAREPAVGLLIQGTDAVVDGKPVYEQSASLLFSAKLDVDHAVTLDLRSRLSAEGTTFGFALVVDPANDVWLTPTAAVDLLTGGTRSGSFLPGVPAPLQQFLASVGLQGLALGGKLPPSPRLAWAGVSLRTDPKARPLSLFGDPTSGQGFSIDAFQVDWTILNPLDPAASTSRVIVAAEFQLWRKVFPDHFRVEIDQDLRIDGEYDGSVSFSALLVAVTAGAIELPPGANDPTFSAFELHIDPAARSYSLACTVDATFDFVKFGGRPLLTLDDMRLTLAASTPTGTGRTTYRGEIQGFMAIGPLAVSVDVSYDGAATPPAWQFTGWLTEPLHLSEIVDRLFRAYDLPSFLPGAIDVEAFAVDATIPVGATARPSYSVGGALSWDLEELAPIAARAEVGLQYDGSRVPGQEFSGSVVGTLELESFGTEVQVGYRFGPAAQDALDLARPVALAAGDSKVLWVAWEGIRGEYDFTARKLTLGLAGWSAGRVIQTLVRTIGDPYFELESPWDFLNQVSLDGLKLILDFSPTATQRFYAEYTLSKPIELGFLTIKGLYFRRGQDGQVTLAIDGSTTIKSLEGPLFDPTKGQSVQNLPQVPGQGSQYFELKLLMLGQRVGIRIEDSKFKTTKDVIEALESVPPTTGGTNPVNPTSTEPRQPYYDPSRGWLVAAHFGLLKVGSVSTFDCMVVFNDPDLYGLRLAFNGQKAKVLDGLVVDVLYKKVTDDVGVYQVVFVFPKSLRTLDLGAFTVTLPTIGVQIYTNGDFLFDLGFPYNLDFSRSFGLQAIIAGVPVLGAAGFYFGRLSVGAAAQLPQSTPGRELIGSFGPAIVFGVGLQLGVGRYYEKGPLRAGFSITVFGIVEGIIAPWNPPDGGLVPAATGSALQGDYYFRLQGTFGLIGKLYGSVDFAVVKADVNLVVTLAARITYEAYADIALSAWASVSVSVSIRINLGFFSIRLSFSFAATITADVTIPSPQHDPPWYPKPLAPPRAAAAALPAPARPPRPKTAARAGEKPTLHLHPAPQFTVLSPDGTSPADEEGAFVFLIATDAPTADGAGNRGGSSFEALCEALFPWVIDALANGEGTEVDLDTVALTSVSRQELQDGVSRLAAHPIPETDIETKLLAPSFRVILEPAAEPRRETLQAGATLFPSFTGLLLAVPKKDGTGDVKIVLRQYVKITPGYRDRLKILFAELAARVEEESGGQLAGPVGADDEGEPLAQFVFEDWFSLVARQLLQAGADAIGDYAYALQPRDSVDTILAWAAARGNALGPLDVAAPNAAHPLTGGKVLTVPGASYTVQRADSLQAIAGRYTDAATPRRWQVTPAGIVLENKDLKGLVAAGVEVSFGPATWTTEAGESFASLAGALGTTVEQLAADPALYPRTDLLAPAAVATIPPIAYTTAPAEADTLQGIAQRFDVPLAALAEDAANRALPDLFAAGAGRAGIRIAGLDRLLVSDVWDAIRRTDQIAQVAGMVARFQLHGMRLPSDTGLLLPQDFLYPSDQPDYGLFQLTGQQFPTPELTSSPTYSIRMAKDATLSWLELPTPTLDLSEQARQLYYLLQYARANPFAPPDLKLWPQPAVDARPKRYAIQSSTPWSTSDQARLQAVTAPPLTVADDGGPQVTPILWNLPDSLLQHVVERQDALRRRGLSARSALQYLPAVQPQVGTSDPATGRTSFTALDRFALATRVQLEVKRLAQTDDLAPQRPNANDVVPPGPGNSGAPSPLAPFNYELVGVGPADSVLLERLLVAMDSLGEDAVAQLFLLYPTAGPGSPGLTSRADDEFLSFITQTNLSTETNPPALARLAAAGREPRGIANTTAEFVKLLWELSTVRSGGYYLYYQLLREGTGLPDALFDSSDTATLTLVIAYDRGLSPLGAARLLDCANALVTTETVDVGRSVLTLESRTSPSQAQPLAGVETLLDVSALYGTDLGRLASLNSTVAFAAGSEIPIAGVVHQVDLADVASADVLATVAAYYSRGAKTPISAAELAAFNPGVSPVLRAALRIPPLTCVASGAAGGPGDTFGSLSGYYGLSYDALGYAARLVPGLYPPRTALTVDSEERDAQAGVGTGNAGLELTRAAPPDPCPPSSPPPCPPVNPTPEQAAAFASATMQQLYTILSAGVRENAFFDQSPQGLPFGPRTSHTPEEADALRHPELRRATLAAGAADPLEYSQALGFGSFSTVNAAPAGDPDGPLPPQADNPYVGVGTPVQLHLRWLDVFGNRIVSALDAPPPGYRGPLDDPPVSIAYSDRIVGLGQWPNVRAEYSYDGAAGSPELTIALTLEAAAYEEAHEGWQQAAANDLKTFTRVYFQLNQDYDALDIPGLSGRAISMSLTNTLLESPVVPLSDAQAQAVRDFVAQSLTYVWHRSRGEPGGVPPTAAVTMPVSPANVAAEDVIPLSLSFTLTRRAELTDPALRAIPGGLTDTTEVLPLTSGDPNAPSVSLERFAATAEAAFETADWRLRIGTSAAAPGASAVDGLALWAVRMAKTPGAGLGYDVEPGASFYAPEPLASALRDGTAKIGRYETGQPFPAGTDSLTFAGVDLNTWAQQAFAAIDAFLSATYAAPAFVVDQLLVADPEKKGYLAKILEHKRTLAGAVARTVEPILVTSETDEQSLEAAEEKLYQALLAQLGAAFTVTAVTVFQVTNAKVRRPLPPGVAPPRFYGQPLGKPGLGGAAEPNFALSTAKIPLTASTGDGGSRLAFLFSSKNVAAQPYVALELSYALSHLEHDITHVPGIEGYEQSSWIKFVTGPFEAPLPPPPADHADPAAVDLPVVLRALPQPPSVTAQTDTSSHPEAAGPPSDLARWDYGFTYLYRAAAQDAVSARVEFNRGPGVRLDVEDPAADLFAALAQFVTVQPAIAADLETYLRPVDGKSKASDTNVQNAGYALAALEQITGAVASAYDAWSKRQALALAAGPSGPAHVVYEFDVVLTAAENGRARVEIHSDDAELPKPFVRIDPDRYEAQDVTPDPPALYAFEYFVKGSQPVEWLSYADALGIPSRLVGYDDLDVFARQDGYASIHVRRNTYVVPRVETTAAFRFSTPQVRFADRIVPLLAHRTYDLGSVAPPPSPLERYLADFFSQLLAGAEGDVAVKLSSAYSFRLVPELPELPPTILPIHLLPPTPAAPGLPFIPPLAAAVEQWLRSHARPADGAARITFGLEVFAGPDALEQKPLLTIADLYVDVADLALGAETPAG